MEDENMNIQEDNSKIVAGYRVVRQYGQERIEECLHKMIQIKISQILLKEKEVTT